MVNIWTIISKLSLFSVAEHEKGIIGISDSNYDLTKLQENMQDTQWMYSLLIWCSILYEDHIQLHNS